MIFFNFHHVLCTIYTPQKNKHKYLYTYFIFPPGGLDQIEQHISLISSQYYIDICQKLLYVSINKFNLFLNMCRVWLFCLSSTLCNRPQRVCKPFFILFLFSQNMNKTSCWFRRKHLYLTVLVSTYLCWWDTFQIFITVWKTLSHSDNTLKREIHYTIKVHNSLQRVCKISFLDQLLGK